MAQRKESKTALFTISGGFTVAPGMTPIHAVDGAIVGYKTQRGEEVRLIVALEVHSRNGTNWVTDEKDMAHFGLSEVDYSKTEFTETQE